LELIEENTKMDSKISGLYKEVFRTPEERRDKGTELELRVDVDGERPLNIISGDLFSTLGNNKTYLNSFKFQVKENKEKPDTIILKGTAEEFNPSIDSIKNIKVSINSNSLQASVQFLNSSGTVSNCLCEPRSEYFRTVLLQHDYEKGVEPFESYDTTNLSSPSRRTHQLSIISAFAVAGIEIKENRKQKPIPHPNSVPGEDPVWTDSQLYDAMLEHFTYAEDEPRCKLWLLSGNEYVICTVNGMMLQHKETQRRGCVVFQIATGWQTPEEKRLRLFIYMHELGHCFNLGHPWNRPQKGQDCGYATLSWMNYPWKYHLSDKVYGGDDFWRAFNFRFTDSELTHLRHGFRNDVIVDETATKS
jgi:hypothetical protein